MPESRDQTPLTPEELRVLARVSGLTIAEERVDAVLTELNNQLGFVTLVEELLAGEDAESDLAPFDPTWPATDEGVTA